MKFENLQDIQKYVEKITPELLTGKEIKDELSKRMNRSVRKHVYRAYRPTEYPRRKDDGGLSDVRNMQFTLWYVDNRIAHVLFENLTAGQDHYLPIYDFDVDTLDGYIITDVIEEGGEGGDWYLDGKWSYPRPFVAETIEDIKRNPKNLFQAIKAAYGRAGFGYKL